MPFDFQQRKSFRFYVILVLEDAAVGDAVLHYFTGILPCAQEVDAGAGMGNGEHVLMIILFHDFGASTDHPFHYLVAGFTAVLHKKGALVFGIEVFALAFKSAEMHLLQSFQAFIRHQFVRHDFQCITGALGSGAVGVVEIDIIKVGWMPSSVKGESQAPWIFLRTLKSVWPWRIKYKVFFIWNPPEL